jgi:hypothetical protein
VSKRRTGPTAAERRRQGEIARRLATTGFVLPGSFALRSYRCGKTNCACHAEPPRLHGPYAQWSHQLEGRTAHVNLSSDQLEDYQAWFDGATRLRRLVGELEALSLTVVERDPRFERR